MTGRISRIIAVVAIVGVLVPTTGCAVSAPPPAAFEGAPTPQDDGGMMEAVGGYTMASSVVAVSRDASLGMPVFDAASGRLVLTGVVAPADGWVLVRSLDTPGAMVGAKRVRAGRVPEVDITLRPGTTHDVLVALHVDRGDAGVLDFDPVRPAAALDKVVAIGGTPLAMKLALDGWGAEALPTTAILYVEDQKAARSLAVDYLLTPGPSWVTVRRLKDGAPGRLLGSVARPAGEYQRLQVPLTGARAGEELLIEVLADRGVVGRLELPPPRRLRSADEPWVSAGVLVSHRISLR